MGQAAYHRHDISYKVWRYWSRICQGKRDNGAALRKITGVSSTRFSGCSVLGLQRICSNVHMRSAWRYAGNGEHCFIGAAACHRQCNLHRRAGKVGEVIAIAFFVEQLDGVLARCKFAGHIKAGGVAGFATACQIHQLAVVQNLVRIAIRQNGGNIFVRAGLWRWSLTSAYPETG